MIRRLPFLLLTILLSLSVQWASAQAKQIQGQYLGKILPQSIEPAGAIEEESDGEKRKELRQRPKVVNPNALPQGNDPLQQTSFGSKSGKVSLASFQGLTEGFPPDPTGAAGPNHYVQAINKRYQVYDKQGNPLTEEIQLNQLWPGSANLGDPVVLYDRFVDRWVITQFQFNNDLLFAVSATSDPTGFYHTYAFAMPSFPDYPKYSIWSDGYYITTNGSPDNVAIVDKQAMVAGSSIANAQIFTMPLVEPPNSFHAALAADADGVLPPLGEPNYIFYFEDDAWGAPQDQIVVLALDVDWTDAQNSVLDTLQIIPTTPFDANFDPDWNDIEQPNTSQRLDAIASIFNFRAQYMRWNGYNSVLLCFAVDVDQQDLSGIRWLELRQDASADTFSIYQEGTYAPADGNSRFIGSMAMDFDGNIGLGFSISGPNTFPSLAVTGRMANDPLGEMTMQEEIIAEGQSSQNGNNRYGDYAHMALDPDGVTFWFTGEFLGENESRDTWIHSFALSERVGLNKNESPNLSFNSEKVSLNFVGNSNDYKLVIYNAAGQIIENHMLQSGQKKMNLNILPAGMYFASLYKGATQRTIKFIVQ